LEEVLESRQQFQPLQDNLRDRGVTGNSAANPALPYPVQDFGQAQILSSGDVSEGEILAPAFAPNFPEDDALESQIQGLNDPRCRKKVIWDLARRGDSRAVKPLVDLMAESDPQERSLILEALSQISGRTLKPMNQALALSLQDLNPQVRKNAVRDLSRLYDVLSQISQLLTDATYDQDEEVQETAKWALSQFHSPGSF
jgi:HEAT repeat protein